MSSRVWRQWSCTVRVVVGQDGAVPGGVMQDAAAVVGQLMGEVDGAVSRFRHDSELTVVNHAAPRLVPVGPLTLALVETAVEAARRTDGAVDPTVGTRVEAWGYDLDIDDVRHAETVRVAPAEVGTRIDWRRVVVDRQLGRVGVGSGLRLDLGATAKAWTVDEAARRVAVRLGRPTLVEIGGDVAVAGPVDAPWRVRATEIEGGPGQVIGVTHGGVATSSTVARRWRTDSGEAHHVIDPRTGRPSSGAIRSASVWASTCVLANTYSTAALVWGAGGRRRLEQAGVSARLVDRDGTVVTTAAWPMEERAA